jgi:LPXTG-motif cell wall-anchored protein
MITAMVAVIMCMGMLSISAFAATQEVSATPAHTDNATITINNPSKGETYSVYKLFDATTNDGKISYKGTVPDSMTDYFEETSPGSGYVQAKKAAYKTVTYYQDAKKTQELPEDETSDFWSGEGMSTGLESVLENWVNNQQAVASGASDGSEQLAFTGLPFGYYVITTTHKDSTEAKCIITVDSTNPSASVYDKNVNEPSANKDVEKPSYTIGDTVKYSADFNTTNYLKDEDGKYWQVIEYTISDTLPAFLDINTVKVTKVTIGDTDYKVGNPSNYPQFDENKEIVIPWATKGNDNKYTNTYANGVFIHIEYEATLTGIVRVENNNTNTVSIRPKVTDDTTEKPWEEDWHDDAVITTYATALKKTDGTSALDGAKFKVPGLTATEGDDGVYTVVSYDRTIAPNVTTFDDGDMTDENSTTLEVNEDGMLYIIGIEDGISLDIWEIEAPAGYNQLTTKTVLSNQELSKEVYKISGYRKYDAKGNIIEESDNQVSNYTQVTCNLTDLDASAVEIENHQGTELPSTGGIGTTIFYVVGAILVVGAGVMLVTRRRMNAN